MNASSTAQSAKEKPTRAEAIQAAIEAVGGKTSTATTTKQTAVSKPEQAEKQTRAKAIQAAIDAVSKPELSRQITPIGAQTPQSSTAAPTVSTEIAPFSEYTAQNRQRRREAMQAAVDAVSPENARKTIMALQGDGDVQRKLNEYANSRLIDRAHDPNAEKNRTMEMKSMADDERALYLYLVKNQGVDAAEEYRKELGLASRALPEEQEAVAKLPYLGKLGVAAVSGLTDAAAGMVAVGDALRGRTPLNNPYDAVSGAARQSIGSGVGRTVYDLVKTGANQLPAMAMGYATGMPVLQTVLMSTGAGGNAYKQGLNEGMTKKQATAYGLINGLSEYLTESLIGFLPGPGGKIDLAEKAKSAIAKNVNSAVGRFAANYGVNSLGEATEEYLQAVLDPLYRYAATGEAQEWDISELWSEEALYAALLGGLSGGLIGGVIDGINGYRAESDYDYYQSAMDSGNAILREVSESSSGSRLMNSTVTEDTVRQAAEFAEATQTPVVWLKSGVLPDGVNAMESGGVVFLAEDAKNPLEALLAHETLHSTEGTAGHTALLGEVDAVIRAETNGEQTLETAAEQYRQNTREKYNADMTAEEAKNEIAAQYVETNLYSSAAAVQLVMSRNSGLIREIAAKRQYKRAYRSADEAGRRALRIGKDFAEGIRSRVRPDENQISNIVDRVQRGETGGRYSRDATVNSIGEITVSDVETLRSIGQKSVNKFTEEDIQKSEKWASKFYQELGIKSPFFRAWFGDWRAYSKDDVRIVKKSKTVNASSGKGKNADTGMIISWGSDLRGETRIHAVKDKISIQAVNDIESIVRDAIYLETFVSGLSSKSKLPGTAWMHGFYTLYESEGRIYLLKLFVEEAISRKSNEVFNRAYQLKDIKKVADVPNGVLLIDEGLTGDTNATNYSISDLYALVKQYDKDFSANPVNPLMLNEDGTPKVFYHGAKKNGGFTVFRPWQYFTEQEGYAKRYAERGNDNSLYAVYLRANKVFDTRDAEARRVFESIRQEYGLGELQDTGLPDWTDGYDISDYLDEHPELGYDAIILDEGGDLVEGEPISRGESIVIKDPTQIKSATDNIGTFDPSNPDIRYSRAGESYESLMEQLKEKVKQYGGMNLPDREIDVPKAVDESGQKVSQTASTYLNATDDLEMRSRTVDGVISKKFNYNPMKISEMDRKTRERIENAGYEKWAERVAEDAETDEGVGISLDRVEQYKILMRMAMERGDYDTAQNCQMLLWPMVSEAAKIMNLQQDIFLKGLDGKRMAKLVKKQAEEKINNKIAEKAKKSRGEVPQETIDRLKEQKAELEKDYRAATETAVEKQWETQGLQRHLNDLQKGIEKTVSDQTKTDKQTAKLAEKLAQKMQEAAAAVSDYAASEEKYQKTKQELREAREELRRLERQTNKNNREEYQYLWDLLLVNESMEKAVEEQRQSSERLRETKEALERSKDYRKLKAELQKLGAGVEVDPTLMAELENAQTQEEIDIAKAHIFQNIADQLPPTLYERFMSWRYLAMLGNPKTWIKNEVGNLANYGLHKMDNLIAYALQRFCVKEGNRVVALNWRHTDAGKAIADKIEKAADAAAEREGSHKYDDTRGSINELRRSFNSDVLEKASGKLDIALNEGGAVMLSGGKLKKLGAGDKPMFRKNYVEALGNYMVAKGLTEVTAEADAYATDVAQAYVFHKDNAISQAVTKLRNSGKGWQIAVDSLMPFIRTPANVLAQGLERSPIGFAAAAVKLTKAAINQKRGTGSVSPELINSMARSTTGTVLFILGVIASAIGLATGDEEGDNAKERSAGELSGAQDLSLDIFGTKISFDWLEPASYPFLLGVLINDGFEKDNALGSLLDAASAGYSQVFDMSMLSGLLDAFTSNYDDGSQMVAQAVAAVFENAATQSIPTLVGQLARAIDPVKRKTTSGESWITDVLGKNLVSDAASTVVSRIPFASKTLEAERDIFGNEVGRVGDKNAFALNAFQQVLSPAAIKKKNTVDDKSDTVSRMLSQLYEDTGKTKVIPTEMTAKKFKEKLSDEGLESAYTSELYRQTKIDVGQAQLEALWELMEENKPVELTETYTTASGKEKRRTYTKRYADMTDEEKTKAIQKAAQKAKDDTLEQLWEELEKEAKRK